MPHQEPPRCPQCEAPIDVTDSCQDCIDTAARARTELETLTHCKAGHLFSEETTGYMNHRRYCLICRRARVNAHREADRLRKKAKRAKGKT